MDARFYAGVAGALAVTLTPPLITLLIWLRTGATWIFWLLVAYYLFCILVLVWIALNAPTCGETFFGSDCDD